MCGIVATVSSGAPVELDAVLRARDALVHRGPDDRGLYRSADGRVVLAHSRLAIVDLERGVQPLSNEDGTVIAVVNGELYGFEELRRDLMSRGHVFKTRSDSEL